MPILHGPPQTESGSPRRGMRSIHRDSRGKKVLAFAGIAKPMSFEKTVRTLGASTSRFVSFPDHHIYKEGDIRETLESRAAGLSADLILTTEKTL